MEKTEDGSGKTLRTDRVTVQCAYCKISGQRDSAGPESGASHGGVLSGKLQQAKKRW